MAKYAWIRTAKIRELERKIGAPLREYLIQRHYDEGWSPAQIQKEIESRGGKLSYRMVHYYIRRLEEDFRRKGSQS